MPQSKRALWFWILVLAAIVMPTSSEGRSKQLYLAGISNNGFGAGSSIVIVNVDGFSFQARTFSLPNQVVQKAAIVSDGASWEVVLCENGGMAGNCLYDSSGNLDIHGPVNLVLAGVSGGDFHEALANGQAWIRLDGGSNGSGFYIRII
jgi:hypothetical protein